MAFNYSPKIVTNGLLVYMDAGNTKSYPGNGTAWTDLGKNQSNNGVLTNSPTFDSSNNGSIIFDGTNDYVVSSAAYSLPAQVTYNFWVKHSAIASEQTLYSDGGQGGAPSGYVWIYRAISGSSGIFFQYSNGSVAAATSTTGMYTGFNGVWLNVGLTVDYTGAVINWYKNGVLLSGPNSLAGTPQTPVSRTKFIGAYNAGLTNPFNGNISIVQIYNRILSASEMLQNYNALKSRYI